MHVWALGLLCETPALAKVEIGQSSSRPSSLGLIEKKWKVFRFPCPEAQMDVEDSVEVESPGCRVAARARRRVPRKVGFCRITQRVRHDAEPL